MKLINQGPGVIHLSDGRVVMPGEEVILIPEFTITSAVPETEVIVETE